MPREILDCYTVNLARILRFFSFLCLEIHLYGHDICVVNVLLYIKASLIIIYIYPYEVPSTHMKLFLATQNLCNVLLLMWNCIAQDCFMLLEHVKILPYNLKKKRFCKDHSEN